MSDSSLTPLQAEWLRRCSRYVGASAPSDVLDALLSVGMLEVTPDGHRVTGDGTTYLVAMDLLDRPRADSLGRRHRRA